MLLALVQTKIVLNKIILYDCNELVFQFISAVKGLTMIMTDPINDNVIAMNKAWSHHKNSRVFAVKVLSLLCILLNENLDPY